MKMTKSFLMIFSIILITMLFSCQSQVYHYKLPPIPERPHLEEVETTDGLKQNFETLMKYSLKLESWCMKTKELVEE